MVGRFDTGRICYMLTENGLKIYSSGQLVFSHNMILSNRHKPNWELICQKNQKLINKDNICKNSKRVDHDYTVGDKFMLTHNDDFKYKIPYKGTFDITQCWTNGMVTLQCGATKIR